MAKSYQAVAHQKDDQVKALTREMEQLRRKLQIMEAQQRRPDQGAFPSRPAPFGQAPHTANAAVARAAAAAVANAAAGRVDLHGDDAVVLRASNPQSIFRAAMLRYGSMTPASMHAPPHDSSAAAVAAAALHAGRAVPPAGHPHAQGGPTSMDVRDEHADADAADAGKGKGKRGKQGFGKALKKLLKVKAWRSGSNQAGDVSMSGAAPVPAPTPAAPAPSQAAQQHAVAAAANATAPTAPLPAYHRLWGAADATAFDDGGHYPGREQPDACPGVMQAPPLSVGGTPSMTMLFAPPVSSGRHNFVTLPSRYLGAVHPDATPIQGAAPNADRAPQPHLQPKHIHPQAAAQPQLQAAGQQRAAQGLQPRTRDPSAASGVSASAGAVAGLDAVAAALQGSDLAYGRHGSSGADLFTPQALVALRAQVQAAHPNAHPDAVTYAIAQALLAPASAIGPGAAAASAPAAATSGPEPSALQPAAGPVAAAKQGQGKVASEGGNVWAMLVQRSNIGQVSQRLTTSTPGSRRATDGSGAGSHGGASSSAPMSTAGAPPTEDIALGSRRQSWGSEHEQWGSSAGGASVTQRSGAPSAAVCGCACLLTATI
ncbi:hypothetical protein GPECTOR_36g131 [Gonium pectorale]|uniref:Uncharacterized protein n=1 Tax=Gonium pectorale TaxID=33097 RepID=A0A150GD60_GONPE|nr:hypothetical protein GPECTOR_36g131 [Gonium pectorale]|eukprot:KXZ47280.1 hypothetical protein GPECTOR_36g131 [Gonium pectorale]